MTERTSEGVFTGRYWERVIPVEVVATYDAGDPVDTDGDGEPDSTPMILRSVTAEVGFSYTDPNVWYSRTVETLNDGNVNIVYANVNGRPLLKLFWNKGGPGDPEPAGQRSGEHTTSTTKTGE